MKVVALDQRVLDTKVELAYSFGESVVVKLPNGDQITIVDLYLGSGSTSEIETRVIYQGEAIYSSRRPYMKKAGAGA